MQVLWMGVGMTLRFNAMSSTELVAAHWFNGCEEAEEALIFRAGIGDVVALRALSGGMLSAAIAWPEDSEALFAKAEVFARLAAAHGEPSDRHRLSRALSLAAAYYRSIARPDTADSLEADCLVTLDSMVDDGLDQGLDELVSLASEFSAEAILTATSIQKRRAAARNGEE